MELILGLLGAALGLGLFAVGMRAGRNARPTPAPVPDEAETRRIREQQQALERLQNYTVDDAYGIRRDNG